MAAPIVEKTLNNYRSHLGEGPHWDAASKTYLQVDIAGRSLLRWHTATNTLTVEEFDDTVGAVVPCEGKPQEYIVSEGTKLLRYNWNNNEKNVIAEVENGNPNHRFNDGKCDPAGRFWTGTMERAGNVFSGEKLCALYCLETCSNRVVKKLNDVGLSNGLDWTNDKNVMFYVDSKERNIVKFDYDVTSGNISNKQEVIKVSGGIPDGLTLDVNNNIWLAEFTGSCVTHIDAETGKIIQKIAIPTSNITSCCFGGENLDVLYVTSDRTQLQNDDGIGGTTFKVTNIGSKGRLPYDYKE